MFSIRVHRLNQYMHNAVASRAEAKYNVVILQVKGDQLRGAIFKCQNGPLCNFALKAATADRTPALPGIRDQHACTRPPVGRPPDLDNRSQCIGLTGGV